MWFSIQKWKQWWIFKSKCCKQIVDSFTKNKIINTSTHKVEQNSEFLRVAEWFLRKHEFQYQRGTTASLFQTTLRMLNTQPRFVALLFCFHFVVLLFWRWYDILSFILVVYLLILLLVLSTSLLLPVPGSLVFLEFKYWTNSCISDRKE